MNKGKVIVGIIRLAVAVLLIVQILGVPQADVTFMVDDVN